jgi:hypothetical protein
MRLLERLLTHPFRAPDDGAGAGADAGAAAGAAGASNPAPAPAAAAQAGAAPAGSGEPAGGQALGGGGPSPVYRPEGLPEHLHGASEKETIDKLWKAYGGAREAIGKFGEVPSEAGGYAFQPSEALAPYLPNLEADPVMKLAQGAAHKHGLGSKQFQGFLGDVMEGLVSGGMLDDPYSPEKERAIIAPDLTGNEQKAAAEAARNEAIGYVDALVAQGKLDQGTADFFKGRSDRGHMIRLVQAIRSQQAGAGLAVGGRAQIGDSEAELDKRIADPRNQFGKPTYSEAFARETRAMAQRLHGDGDPDRV